MKYKYVSNNNNLVFEEDWMNFLNDMLSQGYKLRKTGMYRFQFEPCHHPLKYQIDYTPLSHEYLEVTKELGYEYIDSYYDTHIYCTSDMNATDLQSDEQTLKNTLLKKYSLKFFFILLLLTVFFGICSISIFRTFLISDIGYFYTNFNLFLLGIAGVLITIMFIILECAWLKARQKIKYNKPFELQSPFFRKAICIFCITFCIICLIALIYILYITSAFTTGTLSIILGLILIFIYRIVLSRISHFKSVEARRVIIILVMIFVFCGQSIIKEYLEPKANHYIVSSKFPYASSIEEVEKNIFLTSIISSPQKTHQYYDCLNENIAIKVMNSQELFIEDSQSYSTQIADECYYNDHYCVARKDCLVIKCEIDNIQDIEQILIDNFK